MALKKLTQTAQDGAGQAVSTEAVNDTAEAETGVKEAHSGAETTMFDGYTQFVYVGPSLPSGALKENAVLQGSYSEVLQFLGGVVEEYPQIKRLIVPVHKLGKTAAKVKASGNIVNKYYSDVVSAISGKKEE